MQKYSPDHEYAEKLNNVNTKKKIIEDENIRLKTELSTLRHGKLRDDKWSSDTISRLRGELGRHKIFSDQFTSYKIQTQTLIDGLNKSLLVKEEEIEYLKKKIVAEKSDKNEKNNVYINKNILNLMQSSENSDNEKEETNVLV